MTLRSTMPGMPRKVRATTNPYGVGHNWIQLRFNLFNWPQPGATPFTPDNTLRNVGIGVGVAATVGLFSYFFMRSFNKVTR